MNNINNDYVLNRSRIKGADPKKVNNNPISSKQSTKSFQEILNQINRKDELSFSKHAIQRLQKRNINLTSEDITKLNNAVTKAQSKGVNEALIILRDNAFITSIKNRTVITAATGKDLKENVFTNIDGAVIL